MRGVGAPRVLGEILHRRRLNEGVSVRAIASVLHRSSAFVRAYEAGTASLTLPEVEAVAEALGATLEEIVTEYQRARTS